MRSINQHILLFRLFVTKRAKKGDANHTNLPNLQSILGFLIKINRVKLVLFLKTWFLLRCSSGTTQPIFFKGVMHDILSPEGSCKRSEIFSHVMRHTDGTKEYVD